MLTHLFFDCWIILDDVGEDGSKANLRQQLRDRHLLAVRVLTWSVSLAFGDMMMWGWLLKALTKNNRIASLILEYPSCIWKAPRKCPPRRWTAVGTS
jgi:hypothetical protein